MACGRPCASAPDFEWCPTVATSVSVCNATVHSLTLVAPLKGDITVAQFTLGVWERATEKPLQ